MVIGHACSLIGFCKTPCEEQHVEDSWLPRADHSHQRNKNKRLGAAHERQVHAIQVHYMEGDFRHNGWRNETIKREKDESARLHVFFASSESDPFHQNLQPEKET